MIVKAIGIVGDYNAGYRSHAATEEAISHGAAALDLDINHEWIGTEELAGAEGSRRLQNYSGLWIAPGSPYRNMEGALIAIRTARERGIPVLGTCGGFQHIILEYARNVLGIPDAEHEESAPQASRLFISRLACSLAGRTAKVTLTQDSLAAQIYGATETEEQFLCNFGVNPDYLETLKSGMLKISGADGEGAPRIVELPGHPFFIGTLFVPQLRSTRTAPHPLVSAFIAACRGV